MIWPKKPQPLSQVSKDELESYLLKNINTPIYVVSKRDVITMKVVYDGKDFIGTNYLLEESDGSPVEMYIKNFSRVNDKLTDDFLLYTVLGMKLTLNKLDMHSK